MRQYLIVITSFFLLMGTAVSALAELAEGEIRVNGRTVDTLERAFAAVMPQGIILMGPGEYRMAGKLTQNGVLLKGSQGTVLRGVAHNGKAALVIAADDVTVDTIECLDIAVKDKNGACIRFEGKNLTVKNVYFHDAEQGLLAGGDHGKIIIEDSRFERLGKAGYAHGIYVGGGRLLIRRSRFLASKDQGHEIKSRADFTVIENSIIASLDGDDSRLIDIPNGGRVIIRNNLIVEGPNTVNFQMLSWGVEGVKKARNSFTLINNLIISDRQAGSVLIGLGEGLPGINASKNMIVGKYKDAIPASNFFFETREDLGLPEAPTLPDWKEADKKPN